MSLGERIKQIRKEKNLTQQALGERIGVKQNTIALIESGKRNTSDQLLISICREFSVDERWLRTGEGEMFIEPDTFSLDEYARERGATELDLAIAKVYFDLPPTVRADMLADLKKLLNSVEQANGQEAAEAPPPAPAPKIAAVPARPAEQIAPDPDRTAWEQEADEFAAIARAQFLQEKKRESGVLSASTSDAG